MFDGLKAVFAALMARYHINRALSFERRAVKAAVSADLWMDRAGLDGHPDQTRR